MNLIEGIQAECNRLRETVIPRYENIPTGGFAAGMMKKSIQEAEQAIASGDVVLMVECLKELKGWHL